MKKFVSILLVLISLSSCEDVIDLNLKTTQPRLVIDASINWLKGTSGSEQKIKLTLTSPYFDVSVPPANGAQIVVKDSNNNTFNFIEESNTGVYINNNFIPEINRTYTLEVIYKNETYTATETLKSVAPIDYVEQKNDAGFSGNETELKAYYTDPVEEENYYFFEFKSDLAEIPSLEVYKDEFTNGNQIFGFHSEEDLKPGNQVLIRNYGISKKFYEFMFLLLQQNSTDNGGPFETQPATLRGNIINQTNSENFPLGYFRVSEVDELVYTVE